MPLRLWTDKENQAFFNSFVKSLSITKSAGFRLTRGVLDMSALEIIIKGLENNDYDWLLMDELEMEYPQGSWWEMVWHLAELQNKLGAHTIYEINYKTIKAIENLVIPLNAMFQGHQVNTQFLLGLHSKSYHPLTAAVFRYTDKSNTYSDKKRTFIDCFMQAMVSQHGARMVSFLQICKENIIRLSSPRNVVDDLVVAMNRMSLEA
ncbi:hypothetical protein H4S06_000380 [Coemansia sp. BCRC 34490]|nr:hypothetical protein LPJ72_000507 [Coemansia sp. Benny D160-2]KAJ2504476.1 hypothetical protein GGI11_007349 [Coemansia sp. RSA 2049]KAJ2516247.1 hypothetical protein H4217_004705 [Coemansia sp. RSA 1939]KAJ2612003.1 hypothetical protein EV177_003212 [Coemansia sp. RSA 1804]KAJ2667524.1 hypothetical protein GGH99_006657 [Coemansia sp. RSA 1285]KAJ2762930.1 hypothetical protein H4S06_000380 [Coemansia sp. BCRC 34490]